MNYRNMFNAMINYHIADFAAKLVEKGGNADKARDFQERSTRFCKKKDKVLESDVVLDNE